jgi:hypothetical protein
MKFSIHNTLRLTFFALVAFATSGCTVQEGGAGIGQGFPKDVHYFPPGPEFKLSREAAAKKAITPEAAEIQESTP